MKAEKHRCYGKFSNCVSFAIEFKCGTWISVVIIDEPFDSTDPGLACIEKRYFNTRGASEELLGEHVLEAYTASHEVEHPSINI